METSPKKERLLLALGMALCLGLLAAHYFSSLARKLAANRDIEVALINEGAAMVFIYHPFSKAVTAVNLPPARLINLGSNYQKACAALALVSGKTPGQREDVFYLASAARAEDLSVFYAALNSWRSRPRLFFEAARRLWLIKKEERTNTSFQELLLAALELSRLNSSNFIVTDFERETGRGPWGDGSVEAGDKAHSGAGPAAPAAAIRVEILNASGKKYLAIQVTKYLRKKGFDVIAFGTYGNAAEQTKIVNCSNNIEAARSVRAALGLGSHTIYSKPGSGNVAEVSVVLGGDFNGAAIED